MSYDDKDIQTLEVAQLLNSRQQWGKLQADPDDWYEGITEDEQNWHMDTARALLPLFATIRAAKDGD